MIEASQQYKERVLGRATTEGTSRFTKEHVPPCHAQHFRDVFGLKASSIGIGTHRGNLDDQTDRTMMDAIIESVRAGLNVIDTAINYRLGRSERSAGNAVRCLTSKTWVQRDELILCTKGGYLPVATDMVDWFERRYVSRTEFEVEKSHLVNGCHCIHPSFLREQLEQSLANLGVESVDVYYIHNPEVQLREVSRKEFRQRLFAAFQLLETLCDQSLITFYGLATWYAFRVPPEHELYLDLSDMKALAREAAGIQKDRFGFVQCPLSLAMPEALLPMQRLDGRPISIIELAAELGISFIASASLGQGHNMQTLLSLMVSGRYLPEGTDAQRLLQFTRSVPGVASALVGMKEPYHVAEITALARHRLLTYEELLETLGS